MKLGRRQLVLLRLTAAGQAWTHHAGQGRMHVFAGPDEDFTEDQLDRLLELNLIELGEEKIAGHKLRITERGRRQLALRSPSEART